MIRSMHLYLCQAISALFALSFSFFAPPGHASSAGTSALTHVNHPVCDTLPEGHFDVAKVVPKMGWALINLAVTPDNRVFVIAQAGKVLLYDPAKSAVSEVGQLQVSTRIEQGLLGLEVDPDFPASPWIYLYYTPNGSEEHRLSRFDFTGGKIQLGTEKTLLKVRAGLKNHHGGDLHWGPGDILYLSTGDNVGISHYYSRGARTTSANSGDLRGKILRIKPKPDGSYEIPAGNLFPKDGSQGRPEIYAMGMRNPFRFSVDPVDGRVFWGDVGPDGRTDTTSGPKGYDEFNMAEGPGFFGWPDCIGNNRAYPNGRGGTDCSEVPDGNPDLPAGTKLPPAQPPLIWYPYGTTSEFPWLPNGGGRCAMAGPVYRFNPKADSSVRFPACLDGSVFFWDMGRYWSKLLQVGHDRSFKVHTILTRPSFGKFNTIDMEYAPDGSLYLLTHENSDLFRITYNGGRAKAPMAVAGSDKTSGPLPLKVRFNSNGSKDWEGKPITFSWDFDGDGKEDATGAAPTYTYTKAGLFNAKLMVKKAGAPSASTLIEIAAGNTRPVVELVSPRSGDKFTWGDAISYVVKVTDAEDGTTIDCKKVRVELSLGHDGHAHPLEPRTGCTGTFATVADEEHDGLSGNIFLTLKAQYQDKGAPAVPGAPALTAYSANVDLKPEGGSLPVDLHARGRIPLRPGFFKVVAGKSGARKFLWTAPGPGFKPIAEAFDLEGRRLAQVEGRPPVGIGNSGVVWEFEWTGSGLTKISEGIYWIRITEGARGAAATEPKFSGP